MTSLQVDLADSNKNRNCPRRNLWHFDLLAESSRKFHKVTANSIYLGLEFW